MIVGAGHVSIDHLIDGLQSMAQKRHIDGWGGVHRDGGNLIVRKSTSSCVDDMGFEAYSSVITDMIALHARRSPNGAVAHDLTHPFDIGQYKIFHNTWLDQGDYDPRRLVLHVKKFLKPGEEESSLAEALNSLEGFTGANCVVVSPIKTIIAVRYKPESKKAQHYHMAYSPGAGDIVVSSEQLMGRNWRPLSNGDIITVFPNGKYEPVNAGKMR